MKILFLHKALVVGGIETVLITYLNLFRQLGYEVDLHLIYDLGQENYRIQELDKSINITYSLSKSDFLILTQRRSHRKSSIWYKIAYAITKQKQKSRYQKGLNHTLNTKRYDVIIDFSECLSNASMLNNIRKMMDAKIIRWCHSQISRRDLNKTVALYKKFDKVITISAEMKSNLLSEFGDLEDKLVCLHNPIHIEEIKRKAEANIIEKLPPDYFVVVTRIVEGKGLAELVEIYHILKTKYHLKNKLYFIGSGEYLDTLKQWVTKRKLDDDCLFLGKKENPYPYMKRAKLFLFTSESEGLPTVLLESMTLGTPIVSMNCKTGPTEIIGENNEYGKLIQLHDRDGFCQAVDELVTNEDLYQHYIEKSVMRSPDFSKESVGHRIKELFEKLVDR